MAKTMFMNLYLVCLITMVMILPACSESNQNNNLLIGWAMEDVTPEGPVSLVGQCYERISEYVQSPLKVTAMSIESKNDTDESEQAILISMDFIVASDEFQNAVKERVKVQIPEFEINKLFVNATHTHSAPYPALDTEYGQRVLEKATAAAVNAWKGRKAAGISRALEYVVVGHNRWDIPGAAEIAKRLIKAIKDACPEAKINIQMQPVFKHTVKFLDLPTMKVTNEKYDEAVQVVNEIRSREPEDENSPNSAWNRFLREIKENEKRKEYGPWDNWFSDIGQMKEKQDLIEKYENQDNDPYCRIEVHALRLGNVALTTCSEVPIT